MPAQTGKREQGRGRRKGQGKAREGGSVYYSTTNDSMWQYTHTHLVHGSNPLGMVESENE